MFIKLAGLAAVVAYFTSGSDFKPLSKEEEYYLSLAKEARREAAERIARQKAEDAQFAILLKEEQKAQAAAAAQAKRWEAEVARVMRG